MTLTQIVWNPSPVIHLGSMELRWYGVLFALGFFLAYYILYMVFKKEKVSFKLLDWLTFYFFLAVLVGARLGHCFFYEWSYYKTHIAEIFMVWQGGLASHGAAIAIVIVLIIYILQFKVNVWWLFDRVAIVIPIVAAFVRFGNLMNSEIYGHVTSLPWGFIYLNDKEAGMLPRHPTELYEAFTYLFITALLLLLYRKQKGVIRPGFFVGIFLVIMFCARFLIEFVKEVQMPFEKSMTLDMGQLLSIPFILLGVFFLIHGVISDKIPKAPKEEKN